MTNTEVVRSLLKAETQAFLKGLSVGLSGTFNPEFALLTAKRLGDALRLGIEPGAEYQKWLSQLASHELVKVARLATAELCEITIPTTCDDDRFATAAYIYDLVRSAQVTIAMAVHALAPEVQSALEPLFTTSDEVEKKLCQVAGEVTYYKALGDRACL